MREGAGRAERAGSPLGPGEPSEGSSAAPPPTLNVRNATAAGPSSGWVRDESTRVTTSLSASPAGASALGRAPAVDPPSFSATALVMYSDLQASHAGFAAQLAPIALSSIAIMDLLGALAVLAALRGAHEISPRALGRN